MSRRSTVRRRVIVLIVAALALTIAVPLGQPSPLRGSQFPLAWVPGWLKAQFAWAADRPTTPGQRRGGPVNGPHETSTDATRANGGKGHAPGSVPGANPAYSAASPQPGKQWTTPGAGHGFDEATSALSQAGTSEFVTRYANADGTFTSRVFQTRSNFRDGDGKWRPIDTRLIRGADGRWRAAANSTAVTLTGGVAGADESLASVSFGPGQVLGYTLQGASVGQPSVDGSAATYADALAQTDIQLMATADGIKETLVLKSREAANSWVFPLRLQGLKPTLESDGSVSLRRGDGTVVAVVPLGYMQDSKMQPDGDFTTSNAVKYELITVEGKPALKVSVDRAWLDDPARVYPVKVDPSATTWDNSSDIYVDSSSIQNGNSLGVGCYMASTTCDKRRSFLKFNYYDYAYGAPGNNLANVAVIGANLHLFHTWSENCTQFRKVYAYRVTESWTATSIHYGKYPGANLGEKLGELLITNNSPACTNTSGDRLCCTWWTMPITNLTMFHDWSRDSSTNYGLALTSEDDNDRNGWKRFTSRDSANSGQNAPYLDVTWQYNQAPVAKAIYPPNGYASPTLTPELMVWASDDQYPYPTTCYFQVIDPATQQVIAQSTVSGSDRFTVPAGVLQWSKAYAWSVTLFDGQYNATTMGTFTTAIPQAPITSGLSQNADKGYAPNIGNYTTSTVDAQIPTVGPPLNISRSYNSRDPRNTQAFGAGWATILDARATEITDVGASNPRLVTITYPTGQDVAFGRNNDGSFASPSGRFSSLRAVTGGYELTDKQGVKYTFTVNKTGGVYALTSVADAQGRTLTLNYTNGNVTSLTSASGRKLTLTWSGSHVSQVADDATNTWNYTYSGNSLTKVCPPATTTNCYTYQYGENSQYPTSVLDAGPNTYLRMNESTGAPAALNSATDSVDFATGSYTNVALGQPGPLPSGANWTGPTAAGFNGSTSSMGLQKKASWTSVWSTVSLWFKTTTAGVIYSYQNRPIDDSTGDHWMPALYVDTNGHLVGENWNGWIAPMVSTAVVTNNAWHHAAIVGMGNYQELYLDGQKVGSLSGGISDFDTTNVYVGAGKWAVWPNTTNTVGYFNGSISDFAFYTYPLRAQQIAAQYAAKQYVAAPLTKVIRPSGAVTATVEYNAASGAVTKVTDANNGAWQINAPTLGGSSVVHTAAVLSQAPVDYFRMVGTGNEVNGGTAGFNLVTLNVSGGPFADSTVATFNSANPSYVQLPAADVTTTGTGITGNSVSLWFKTTGSGVLYGQQTDALTNPNGTGAFTPALYVGTDGKLRGKFWNGNNTPIVSAGTVNDGTWHHVVLAASTSAQTLYLDGATVGTLAGAVSANGTTGYVGAGKWSGWDGTSGTVSYFNGQIAEFAFYRTEVKADAVKTQFAARDKAANQGAGDGVLTKTITVTDPGGKTLSYVYDLSMGGRQVRQIDARGGVTTYGFDTSGYLRTTEDPNKNLTIEEHDVRGNVIAKTMCQSWLNNKCSTTYTTYYPDATTKVLTPDARNDLVLTSSDGRSSDANDIRYRTTYAYDVKGNVTSVTDPLGRVTKTDYTDGTGGIPAGLPTKVTYPNGATQTTTYDTQGNATKIVDKAGLETQFQYNSLGRVTTKTVKAEAGDLITQYTYDEQGRSKTQTDPLVADFVTGPEAQHTAVTTTVYDVDGAILTKTVSDSTGHDASRTVENHYDSYGRLDWTKDALGRQRTFTMDLYGNKVTETDPSGTQMAYAYDATGQLISTTLKGWTGDPNNPSPPSDLTLESRAYDPAGRLASITDAMGWVTEYKYYDNGLTQSVTRKNPSTSESFVVESDEYDLAGNVTKKVTSNGATTTDFVVDNAGRVTSQTVEGVNRTTNVIYGADDTVTSTTITDGTSKQIIDSAYDIAGRKLSQTVSNGSANALMDRWRLNESTGLTASDPIGNLPATLTSGVSWTTDGTRGQVAHFDGSTGKISMATPIDTTRAYSISAWVRLTSGLTDAAVLAMGGDLGEPIELKYDHTNGKWLLVCAARATDGTATWVNVYSANAAALNAWTHLVAVVDPSAGSVNLYVNGQSPTSGNTTNGAQLNIAANDMRLSDNWAAQRWNGELSDVQVYQKALGATDVTSLYGGTSPGAPVITRTSWTVDKRGLQTTMRDPNGNVSFYTYDAAGQLVQTTSPTVMTEENGGTPVSTVAMNTVGYNTFGEQVETKDAKGRVTVTARDANGQATQVTLPSYTPPGSSNVYTPVTTTVYDVAGQVTQTQTPDPDDAQHPRTTSYEYDQLGRLTKVTAPNGGVTKYTYTLNGEQLSVTDANGARSEATYDYLGRRVTTTAIERSPAAVFTTNYAYDTAGRLYTVTPPGRNATTYEYNAAGETTKVTDAAGNATQIQYDFAGRQTTAIAADNSKQVTTFDAVGRPTTQQQLGSDGSTLAITSTAFDAAGQAVATTDALGNTMSFSYDATGLVTQMVEPVDATHSITTSFGYDMTGRPSRFTDGNNHKFVTTYNSWGLVESEIEPDGAAFTTSYDIAGRAVTRNAPGGVTVANAYNKMDQLVSQSGSGAETSTAARSFGYDLGGRMTSFGEGSASSALSYNDRGLLTSTSGSAGSSTFTWTGDGKMASRQDAAGTSTYNYDTAGRLSSIVDASTGEQASYAYNALAQPTQITYGTGNKRAFAYFPTHRLQTDTLSKPDNSPIGSIAYTYDANGNEKSKATTGFAGASVNTYTYDNANRLKSWNNGATTTQYDYDDAGNRIKVGARDYHYNSRNELTDDGNATYTYTARGTLSGTTVGTVTTPSTFDAYGQQISQGTTSYTYDGVGRVLSSSSGQSFTYTGTGNDVAADGTATYSRTPAGAVFGEKVGSTGVYAWTDLHADVVGQFGSTSTALSGSRTYNPFGAVLASSGLVGNLGYQSGWTDPGTSRVNMHARWYNTDTGQFASRDSLTVSAIPSSIRANRYEYGDGNPMTVLDPTGHCGFCSWLGNKAKSVASSAWNGAKSAWNATTNFVSTQVSNARDELRDLRDYAKEKFHQAKDFAVQKINNAKEKVKQTYQKTKQAIVNTTKKVVNTAISVTNKVVDIGKQAVEAELQAVKDAYKATADWVAEHKDAIIEFAVGTIAFVGCEAVLGALTAGVGAVAGAAICGAVAGMVSGLVGQGLKCANGQDPKACSVGSFVEAGLIGGVTGAIGGAVGGAVGGKLVQGLVKEGASALTRFAGGAAAGAISGGIAGGAAGAAGGAMGYAFNCQPTCSLSGLGHASLGGAKDGASSGALFGGLGGGFAGLKAGACHSFDPSTKVLTAAGAAVAISQIKVGDKVKATDPVTGKTTDQPVTALHRNLDTDIVNVTVSTKSKDDSGSHPSSVITIQTTEHHPFWSTTKHGWVNAIDLEPKSILTGPNGETLRVVSIQKVFGFKYMRDLTVNEVHTYYVMAGDQAVLVHNCGTNENNRSGLDFTDAGRDEVYAANAAAHNGQLTCEYCGRAVTRRPSQSGVPGLADDAQIDHQIPKYCDGCGDPHNGVVACRACNRDKSNKTLADWDAELRDFLPNGGLIDARGLNLISL